MDTTQAENKEESTSTKSKKKVFDFENPLSNRMDQEFKDEFVWKKGSIEAIKSSGLTAYGHFKGIKRIDVNIIMFPTQENNLTCICKGVVVGYGWSPSERKVVEVEFSDIADASPQNCGSMVKDAYIRMAATRAISRALRKYTNIDIVSADELSDFNGGQPMVAAQDPFSAPIAPTQLNDIKAFVTAYRIAPQEFTNMLLSTFNKNDFMTLTAGEGFKFLSLLIAKYVVNQQPAVNQQPN